MNSQGVNGDSQGATGDSRELAAELSIAVVRLTRHLRGQRATAAVTLTQLSALATLAREGDMTPGALAALERVQPPSMTRVIGALVDAGLVDRKPHATDGRQVIVALTDKGRAIITDESHAREAWMAARLQRLDEAERKTLADAVAIMTAMVNDRD
ncbi:MarR family transcriptional regulator [Rhodococcus sp. HNM0569]|uniref:MarR family winged helix-turn-helix transcriptional regulator n=1 Tax=Rhodococcus sp. HNM0569 TaxID=2716340 RepID=UPI001469B113|nr:MarR family transcriptional regulator [Rhodococcus sp. HNM0569]NLU82435.1 MarR family transcriptional regulator [Rhodococcus sp. HNM0569]